VREPHGARAAQRVVLLDRYQAPLAKEHVVEGRDVSWAAFEAVGRARPEVACTPVASTDPLYVLYTSGTTGPPARLPASQPAVRVIKICGAGEPKGIVRDNGGHLVALKWSMRNVFAVNPGEVFWAASDVVRSRPSCLPACSVFALSSRSRAARDGELCRLAGGGVCSVPSVSARGRVVGHTCMVYGPLSVGATTVLFEVGQLPALAALCG
jgi:acyl-coenzyme A synthetase/AMP-(fatty) acid ligase